MLKYFNVSYWQNLAWGEIDWISYLMHEYLHALFIMFVFFILRKFLVARVFTFISKRLNSRAETRENLRHELAEQIFIETKYIWSNLIFMIGVILAINVAGFEPKLEGFAMSLANSFLIFYLGYGCYVTLETIRASGQTIYKILDQRFDLILIAFTIKILDVLVLSLTFLFVLQQWGFDITAFIAGLGLGGVAIALAAKDLVANIFAGFVVITDKPYSIGDWIETTMVSGTVEEITFRSTRIRTFANAQVTVPNAKLIDSAITNWSRMQKRRVNFNLKVTFDTSAEGLVKIRSKIEDMLRSHPEVHQEMIFVRFNEFSVSSLDIMIYYFTKSIVWADYLRVREDTMLKIIQILNEEKVDFAVPIQALKMEADKQVEEEEIDENQREVEKAGKAKTLEKTEKTKK